MLTLKNHLRFGRLNLRGTVCLLIAGLATGLSLAQVADANSTGTGRAQPLWLAIANGLQADAQKDQARSDGRVSENVAGQSAEFAG